MGKLALPYFTTCTQHITIFFCFVFSFPPQNLNELSGDDRYSGVMMWPGSDLEYQRRHPTFYHGYDNVTSWQTRVDTVLNWILNETTPANLVLLYFEQPDFAGHHFGPDSDELNQQLVRINNITGYLMNKLTEGGIRHLVNMFFLADHGMAAIQNVINLDEYVNPNAYTVCSGSPGLQILPRTGKYAIRNLSFGGGIISVNV